MTRLRISGATAPRPVWLDPAEYTPPRGSKLLLLTGGGIATVGQWGDDCIAWLPLPDSTATIKRARAAAIGAAS